MLLPNDTTDQPTSWILVTGAAGFLGSHVIRFLQGRTIIGVDDLSRPASVDRLSTVKKSCQQFIVSRVADLNADSLPARGAGLVIHLAAQVGLNESWIDPEDDFSRNAGDTVHLLSLCRQRVIPPKFILISSNKVYGQPIACAGGIGEKQPIKVESPYALSKASAELAVQAAHSAHWVRGAILRCSCLYGEDQRGTESQGWVSHFVDHALAGTPVCIHGSGDQIRDVLYVQDWLQALAEIIALEGQDLQIFNLGGGPDHLLSPNLLWSTLEELLAVPLPPPERAGRRPGDQDWYVSDISKAAKLLNWRPETGPRRGLQQLLRAQGR